MPDYKKGKIYRIVCNTTGLVYIGSTTQTLDARLAIHKSKIEKHIYSSYRVMENNNYKMELIEHYPCENNEQLRIREEFHCSKTDCVNIIRPYISEDTRLEEARTRANEYRVKFPEKVKAKKQQDYESNREVYIQRASKWRLENSEKYKEGNRQRHMENRDKWVAYNKQYYLEHGKTQIKCECGIEVSRNGIARHRRTQKHTEKISAKSIDTNDASSTTENSQTEIV
jgi:hypothetical protein